MSDSRKGIFLLLSVIVLTVVSLWRWDVPVASYCVAEISPEQHHTLVLITRIGEAKWWFALSGGGLILALARLIIADGPEARRRRIAWLQLAGVLFLNLAIAGLIVVAVKWAVGRYRPPLLFDHGLYGVMPLTMDWNWATRSFPSGHAQTMWSVAMPLMMFAPKWRWPLGLFAAAISLTRILLAEHFVSDVLVGAAIAVAVAYLLRWRYGAWLVPQPIAPKVP